jgi:hypothetical protein
LTFKFSALILSSQQKPCHNLNIHPFMKSFTKLLLAGSLAISFVPLSAQLNLTLRPDTIVCPGTDVKLNSQVTYPQTELSVSSLVVAGSAANNTINGIAADNAGNYVITGSFSGTLTLGNTTLTSAGGDDIYIAKFNASHILQWAVRSGGVNNEAGKAIAIDASNNIYVTGYFGSSSITLGAATLSNASQTPGVNDIFVTRLNPNTGATVWAQKAGGPNNDNVNAIFTNNSGVWLTGAFTGSAAFNTGTVIAIGGTADQDYFVCRYAASNGGFNWVRRAGGSGADEGFDLVADGAGNLTVTGKYAGSVQFGTTAAHAVTSVNGTFDVFSARYNNSGTLQWVRSAGGPGADEGKAITMDGGGSLYVMASTGASSLFTGVQFTAPANIVACYATSGTQIYARKAIEINNGSVNVKAFRKNPLSNQIIAVGDITGTTNTSVLFGEQYINGISGSRNAFTANFDIQLNNLSAQISSAPDAVSEDVSFNPSNGLCHIAGTFTGNLGLGNLSVTGLGGTDGFVSKLNNTTVAPPVYSWSPSNLIFPSNISSPVHVGATTETTFTLTVTAGSESVSGEVTIGVFPVFADAGSDQSICIGSSALLQANGGISYSWQPAAGLNDPNSATPTATPVTTTTYTLTANGFGCSTTDQVVISVLQNPVINISPSSPVICAGNSVTLTASGASGYVWAHSGSTTASVTVAPVTTTTYTVTGTSSGNCSTTRTITVVVNPNPVVAINSSPSSTICSGSSATLTASGAASYIWSPSNLTTASITVSPTSNTTYTVTGTQNGCNATATRTITVASNPTISTSASISSICPGATTVLSASGASTYSWQPGNLSGSVVQVNPTSTTTYTVTGTNTAGCSRTATRTITVKQLPSVSISANRTAVCVGQSVTLTASGANSYVWQPGNLTGATRTFTPAATTTYTVTGTTNGCSSTQTIIITVGTPPAVLISASPNGAVCTGSPVLLSASGAVSYTWMPGNLSGSSITVNPASTTTYTVTGNNNGCIATSTRTVVVNNLPVINAQASPATLCFGTPTVLSASGADNYTWQPGNLTGNGISVTPLTTTTYTVTGTNTVTGCSGTQTIAVTVNNSFNVSITASDTIICSGESVTLTGSGATNYVWLPENNTGSTQTFSPNLTTTYTVIGSTGSCTDTATVDIVVNSLPVVSITPSSSVVCPGSQATLTASGASVYSWQPGNQTGSTYTVFPTVNSTYTLTGTDINGCTSTGTASIGIQSVPVINAQASPATVCFGTPTVLSASGADTYTWQPGNLTGNGISVTPLTTTTYTVTGTNTVTGCSGTQTITVTVDNAFNVSIAATDTIICSGESVTLTGSGATNYVWLPENTTGATQTFSPNSTTTYTVIGSTGSCTDTATVAIVVNSLPVVSITPSSSVICQGSQATLTASGAASYTWQPGNLSGSAVSVSPTVNSTYTLTGTDINGCTSTSTTFVGVQNPPPPVVIFQSPSNAAVCEGTSITLTAPWQSASTYNWQPGNLSGQSVSVSPADTTVYTVTRITNGVCISTATVQVNILPKPELFISAADTQACPGTTDTLFFSGSNYTSINFYYSLNGSGQAVTNNFYPAYIYYNSPQGTNYYAIATSANGCRDTATFIYAVAPESSIMVREITTNENFYYSCTNDTITVQVTSSNGNALWEWDNDTSLIKTIILADTFAIYYVSTTDTFGCTASSAFYGGTLNADVQEFYINADTTAICPQSVVNISHIDNTYMYEIVWLPNGSSVTEPVYSNYLDVYVGAVPETITVRIVPYICPDDTAWKTIILRPNIPAGGLVPSIVLPFDTICNDTASVVFLPPLTQTNAIYFLRSLNVTPFTDSVISNGIIDVQQLTPGMYALFCKQTFTAADSINICEYYTGDDFWVFDCFDLQLTASSDTVCAGDSITLTASGTGSYRWLPSLQTGPQLTVAPNTTTTYSVIGTEQDGDEDTLSVTIVVNPLPVITAFGPTSAECSGSPVQIHATGADNYTWMPGNLTGDTVIVTPENNQRTFIVTGSDANGCISSDSLNIDVLSGPVLSLTPSRGSVCINGIDTLTRSAVNASSTTFSVVSGNPVLIGSNGNQLYYSFTNTTTFRYTAVSATGCTDTVLTTVTVLPVAPVIVSDNLNNETFYNTCVGFDTLLLSTNYPNASVTWNPFGITAPNMQLITADTVVEVFVEVTDTTGCTANGYYRYNYQSFDDFVYTLTPGTNICQYQGVELNVPGFFAGSLVINNEEIGVASYTFYGYESDFNIEFSLVLSGCNDTQTVIIPIDVVQPPANLNLSLPFDTLCSDSSQSILLSDFAVPAGGVFYYSGPQTAYTLQPIDTLNPNALLAGEYVVNYFYFVFTDSTETLSCDFLAADTFYVVGCNPAPRLLHEQTNIGVMIAPNPTEGTTRVTLSEVSGKGAWYLYDNLGQIIRTAPLVMNSFEIDMSGLPSGVYQLIISDNGHLYTEKLIRN